MFNHHRGPLLREIALVLGWLAVALLGLTLFSYSPDDPGWSSIGEPREDRPDTGNWLGLAGAYLADVLLSLLGRSAYLLCAVAFVALHALLRPRKIDSEHLGGHWCLVGVLLFIFSAAALENLRFTQGSELLPSGAGGGIGALIAGGMRRLFGEVGASLMLMAIWMISWSLAAALSWFAFFELIGAGIEKAAMFVYVRVRRAVEAEGARRHKRRVSEHPDAKRLQLDRPIAPSFKKRPPSSAPKKPAAVGKTPPLTASAPAENAEGDSSQSSEKDSAAGAGEKSGRTAADTEAMMPPPSLLDAYQPSDDLVADELLETNKALIKETLQSFNISVSMLDAYPGPVITRYDILPDAGVKGAQIVSLVRDIARSLSVAAIRVLETIPGKNCMGLEIPNHDRQTVFFSEIVNDDSYQKGGCALPLALGKNAAGVPTVVDLAKMPHLLVAGATGSGKSVCINAMLLSLLFSSPPEKMRLLLIDPKMLELSSYHGIPHLIAPVVTDVERAPAALNWAVEEMENRYRLMSAAGARNIDSYNQKLAADNADNPTPPPPLPYIVVVIDELADLMMTTGKKVEITISRLAQKARASGIHLILATQRPSVDVITGLIKANVPCRIAFQVASKVDSRTIIDQMGADMLLGMGDMLYLPAGAATPQRVHGAYISDDEVRRVADHLRATSSGGEYQADFSRPPSVEDSGAGNDIGSNGDDEDKDELYAQAVDAVLSSERPSISLVQRKLRIGYNRAARLIEEMEAAGVVSPIDHTGARKILMPRPEEDNEH